MSIEIAGHDQQSCLAGENSSPFSQQRSIGWWPVRATECEGLTIVMKLDEQSFHVICGSGPVKDGMSETAATNVYRGPPAAGPPHRVGMVAGKRKNSLGGETSFIQDANIRFIFNYKCSELEPF